MKVDTLQKVVATLAKFCKDFTGNVRIHFSQGGLTKIEKFEEVPIEKD